jgi:hypothetical protein
MKNFSGGSAPWTPRKAGDEGRVGEEIREGEGREGTGEGGRGGEGREKRDKKGREGKGREGQGRESPYLAVYKLTTD